MTYVLVALILVLVAALARTGHQLRTERRGRRERDADAALGTVLLSAVTAAPDAALTAGTLTHGQPVEAMLVVRARGGAFRALGMDEHDDERFVGGTLEGYTTPEFEAAVREASGAGSASYTTTFPDRLGYERSYRGVVVRAEADDALREERGMEREDELYAWLWIDVTEVVRAMRADVRRAQQQAQTALRAFTTTTTTTHE